MTIEVKQLVIKSTVTNTRPSEEKPGTGSVDLERLKQQLLAACREMISDKLNSMQER